MNKKIQLSVLSLFLATALIGSVMTFGDELAYASKKKINDVDQFIEQFSSTAQSSSCDSGGNTTESCNNVALTFNLNEGNNAAGQQ